MSGPPPGTARDGDDAEVVARSLEQPESFALLYDRYAADIHRYAARRLGDGAADDSPTRECARAGDPHRRHVPHGVPHPLALRPHSGQRPPLAVRHSGQPHRQAAPYRGAGAQGAGPHRARPRRRVLGDSWVEDADSRIAAQGPLAGALAALSAGDRNVLLLVAWADLTYQEVAEALGIPVGTVRSRLNRARRKVRSALGADPAFVNDAPEVA